MLNSEKAVFAMNDVDDNHLESARVMLGYETGKRAGNTFKKRIITFALAAALILGLSVAAYAIYRATMYTREPEKGTTEYHVLYQSDSNDMPQLLHVNFDKTKLALSFDVPEGGYFPVMRASRLPGEEENWQNTSFYGMLETAQYFGLPWEMKQLDPSQVEIRNRNLRNCWLRQVWTQRLLKTGIQTMFTETQTAISLGIIWILYG